MTAAMLVIAALALIALTVLIVVERVERRRHDRHISTLTEHQAADNVRPLSRAVDVQPRNPPGA